MIQYTHSTICQSATRVGEMACYQTTHLQFRKCHILDVIFYAHYLNNYKAESLMNFLLALWEFLITIEHR
jgi:hypothetical protein